ncbi:hypothetical protein QTP88_008029 [Uroleucon formosanum]
MIDRNPVMQEILNSLINRVFYQMLLFRSSAAKLLARVVVHNPPVFQQTANRWRLFAKSFADAVLIGSPGVSGVLRTRPQKTYARNRENVTSLLHGIVTGSILYRESNTTDLHTIVDIAAETHPLLANWHMILNYVLVALQCIFSCYQVPWL